MDNCKKAWKSMNKETLAEKICESLAKLWKIHPFREENVRYVRTAIVEYNAYFAYGNIYSKKEYLEKIVFDSLE